jgi:hypothetical protein
VAFKVDGQDKSAAQVTLGPNEKSQILFAHVFESAGSHVIEVAADADPLKADNHMLASISVRDRLPVLLVNGDPSSEPLKGETDFAEIALQPFASGRVEMADLIKTRVAGVDALDEKVLNESSVIVLANVRRLQDGQVRALENFVRTGGGLLIFPGSKADTGWYQSALTRDGKSLLPMALAQLAGDAKENASGASIVSQRFENPALEIFNDPRNGSLGDAAIRQWFRMKEPATPSMAADSAQVLARLDNGDPFLAEKKFGEGRVILCATALDADWSNLPMRPFYLPLMQRLCVYLASTVFPPRNLDTGKALAAFLPASDVGKTATLTLPSGSVVELPVMKKGERGVVEYSRTERPGLYTLQPPGAPPLHYVVNADRRESDLAKLSETEISALAKAHGAALVRSAAKYKQLENKRRFGTELWKPLLWLLLALIAAEMLLEQRFSGVRRKNQEPLVKPSRLEAAA